MKIVVVDDQTAVRDGLVTILELVPGIDVVGAGADGAEAIELVEQHRPDVVLMDLRMPRVDGVEATKQVRARWPATQVVVLTTYADDESVLAALAAGAIGFLTKDASREQIRLALEAAVAGHAHLDPAAHAALVESGIDTRRAHGSATRRPYAPRAGGAGADRGRPLEPRDR